ncbi:tartrate-sensitive acid phosphatase [Leishmania donovani]|uniref:Tartrate-sensitive_acid_phosphatase_acp-3.2_putat ive/GeneDB:LmjF.36.6460 n=1 Tax=Leishmania donovani TaxID=5661 RepID=A0A6J8FUA5_LEIDO|nr:tartrate-sensitive acid phosphatase [Leishmania donovani]VDZ49878.1 tartrate-sensitive_acid_phosphatase_acp-3.2_putative/GeneDB:LmjF.36.6460 [Leishmania donovani]
MASKLIRVLAAALLVAAAVSVDARLVVRMVQVVHRHGARSALINDNTTEICGTLYPCGELTGEGVEMVRAIGEFARSRYNDLSLVESPLFPSTQYNSSLVYTRSTHTQRTIQSATAFLRGLFQDDYFYPVVYSRNRTTDMLLSTDAVPSVMGRSWLDNPALYAALNPVIDEHLSWDAIQSAAKDAWIEGLCTDFNARTSCVLYMYDVAAAFEAAGRLDNATNLKAVYPGLMEVNAAWFKYVFSWNHTSKLDLTQGSASQNLAQTMLANINAHRLSPSYNMFEYSAHDTTVVPLAVTFGDQGNTTMRPPFAVTIFVELLQDTADASGWYVRLIRGNPVKIANGTYVFRQTGIEAHCIDAAGIRYRASAGICPLDDFRRMVDYSRPAVAEGHCAMTQAQYSNMGCPRTIADNKPVPSRCWIYRYACPSKACPVTYILSAADHQCYPGAGIPNSSSSSDVTTATASSEAPPAAARHHRQQQRGHHRQQQRGHHRQQQRGTTASSSDVTTASSSEGTTTSSSEGTTASSSDVTTASSEGTTASSSEGTTASSSDVTTASSSEGITASSSEGTTASSSDVTTASSSEGTTTSSSEGTTASSSDVTTASSSEGTTASSSDVTTASSSEGTTASSSEGITASSSEGTTASSSEGTSSSDVSFFKEPASWMPHVFSPKKGRHIAADILRGVPNGFTVGAVVRKHDEYYSRHRQ